MTDFSGPPQLLTRAHDSGVFDCGEPELNEWLKKRALNNQASGASRTFVVVDEQSRVVAYYALSAGAVSSREAPGSVRRNMPDPVPVMVLGRLAVDLSCRGKRLGTALLKDAFLRTATVAENVGVRALLVHAINESAKQFYLQHGFTPSPVNPLTLMLRLSGASAR